MRVFYEYAKLPLDFGLFPQKVWKVLLTTVAVLAMLVINSPASATPPSEPTTVTGLGASSGWYSDDTRNSAGADLVGSNFTQYGKPGQTPSTTDDSAISQQLQFVGGPIGSTGGGSVKIIAPNENPGKSTLSTVNLDGFAAASVLTDASFSATYRWYKEPNPTSRTVAFRIGIQSTAWADSQVNFTATRSGEQTWDLMLVNLMDGSVDNAWNEVAVNKDTGTWHLYGQSGNQNWIGITGVVPPGGSSAKTLAEWAVDSVWGNRLFGADAKITNVQFGLGSWQRQANAYIDYLETTILNNGNRINFAAPVLVVDGTTSEIKSGHTTIQAAINAAAPGDVIEVGAGTYAGNIDVSKAVTISGPNAAISGNGTRDPEAVVAGAILVNANGVTISGLSINGTTVDQTPSLSKRGILVGNTRSQSNVTITNNIITNWVTGISLAGGATPGWVNNAVITGNLLVNNSIGSTDNATNLTIQSNAFTNGGIGLGGGATMAAAISGNTFSGGSGRYVSIASGVPLFAEQTLADILSANAFDKAAALSAATGQWYSQAIFASISDAVTAAAMGAEINVIAGTYLETINLNKDNLTLRSTDGAETTTIRGGGGAGAADAVVRFSANGVTLQGFTIDRANAAANSRAIAPMASDGATISNNIIINSFRGIQGDFYGKPINLTISGNTFADTVQYGIAGTEGMTNLTISGNTFRTTVEGIGLGVGIGLAGTPEQLFDAQIWQLSAGYAIKDYRVSGEPIIGAPYLAVPADLVIYQGAANSSQPAGVNLTATIPISLDTNGHAIGSATFSLASSSCFNIANPDTDVQLASGQSGVDLIATLNAGDGALDIAIISASSLVNGLLVNVTVNYTTTNDCLNPGNGVTAVQFLTGNEAPTFGSVAGGSLTAGTSQNGSLRPRWGDCNGDGSIDAGDISACILEIFDRDGSSRTAALYSGFSGTIFCDSNQDLKIDAGDLVCTVRTINSLTCTASVSAQSLSSVMVETSAVSDNAVQSSLVLNTNNSAAAAVFALEINPAYHFDATDSDGNGLPDALQLQIPADYQAAAVYDADTRLLQVIVASLSVPTVPLADGPLATLVLTSAGPVESAQPFTIQDISLGDIDGGSLPLEVVDLPTQMNSRLYLPSVIR